MKTNEKQRQLTAAAVILVFAGSGILLAEGGRYHEYIKNQQAALQAAEIAASVPAETIPYEEAVPPEVPEETVATESESTPEYEPAPDKLNLAYYYPDGSDSSDIINSYAGQVFQELTILDTEWLADLYELADVKPSEMAERLGRDRSAIQGSYNPKDTAQDPSNPDTWILDDWKRVNVSFIDGDGHSIAGFSNVKDILAMASVYTYYADMMDSQLFSEYAHLLWENSHSYILSMSDVYYCDGCLDKTDEEVAREEEALESAAMAMVSTEELSAEIPETEEISAPSSLPETASPSDISASPTEEALPRVILHNHFSASETDNAESSAEPDQAASPSDAVPASFAETEGENPEAEEGSSGNASAVSSGSHTNCPGHIDLNIRVKILGLSENSGLYRVDSIGADPEKITGKWEGWTEQNKNSVNTISTQDWFADYGLSISSLSLSTPLTSQEIQEYMDALPDDLSQTRRDILYFALSSVGRVPYYYGGKASAPGYEGNNFGALVSSDHQGRILKGLDCSGWINWVYWSATGQRLAGESTSSLILCGEKIDRSQLQPGDIVVRTGTSAHVVMFLSWSADGRMNVIHESSASVNNVTIKTMDAAWPYYRKLVE